MQSPKAKSSSIESIYHWDKENIYGDRQADYGSVTENFSNIARGWEIILKVKITPEQVGLCMIWLKMAREMNVSKRDNIVDIAGYAGCMEKLSKGE